MRKLEIRNYTKEGLEAIIKSNSDYTVGIRLMACYQVETVCHQGNSRNSILNLIADIVNG